MDKKKFNDLDKLKVMATYGIIGMVVLGILHCAFLIFNIDLFIIHILACVFGLVLGIVLSKLFGMCVLHRCCVYYIITLIMCIVMRKYGLFGPYLFQARAIMMMAGVILMIGLVWKKNKKIS